MRRRDAEHIPGTTPMIRGLVLLLLLVASYVTPPRAGIATGMEEVHASQLASESVATLDKGGPKLSGAVERLPLPPGPFPPGPGGTPPPVVLEGSFASLLYFAHVETVVQERAPRVIPVAREVARRDQRPGIRRLKHRAPSLDTASSNA